MAVEILVAAHDLNHSLKGYPKNIKDIPCVWGNKEGPPDYVILRVTGTIIKDQIEYFLQQWHKKFAYDIIVENDQGYRIRVKVDPSLVSVSGMNKEVRTEMKTYFQDTYNATVFSYDNYEAVVDVPKPIMAPRYYRIKADDYLPEMGEIVKNLPDKDGFEWVAILSYVEITLQELKEDIHDVFAEVIDHRFYYFDSADVDYALTQPGGIVERTKTQVLAMIKSKLDD